MVRIFEIQTYFFNLLIILLLLLQFEKANAGGGGGGSSCNIFQGKWVLDSSYPLYNSTNCPFIQHEFNCLKNGRPDSRYLNFRWQPNECKLSSTKIEGIGSSRALYRSQ
ncbi:hypothetical protein M9H77_21620 [Catharanthus roseus]|uniref:Uncharacterized protein n=1 Tax=Catharanthus roseus TaxID=4058 RepID=A0ACC0AQN0_CATRO|nr:hypothetical protein M9H77_21620 [Catharanthus roseus]